MLLSFISDSISVYPFKEETKGRYSFKEKRDSQKFFILKQ